MQKILIIQNTLPHYREAFFNKLSEEYKVTILHSGNESKSNSLKNYSEILTPVYKFGPFLFQKKVISLANSGEFDAIISMCDLHWANSILILWFHNKKSKFVFWGSWFTDKYFIDKLKILLACKSDANIFYCKNHREAFLEKAPHLNKERQFVANNTIYVKPNIDSSKFNAKDIILFVGSLNPRKQLGTMIRAFSLVSSKIPENIKFQIVGDGEEFDNIISLVNSLHMSERIVLMGRQQNDNQLTQLYKRTIVSISFGQAGLSVLQSFGYGVPFVTKKNAISGGETTNIIHGYNGYLCEDSISSLAYYLELLCNNLPHSRQLGENAYKFYEEHCTISKMVDGFRMAIE